MHMKQKICSSLFLLFISALTLHAQVTIGSATKPLSGTLLDLKEDDASMPTGTTAKRGLSLPRVELTDNENLYPMFETSPGNGVPDDNYNTVAKKQAEDAAHIGLTVYHPTQCMMAGPGIYVWDGTRWKALSGLNSIGMEFNQMRFDIPSGHDARGAISPQTLKVTWGGNTVPNWTITANNGLSPVSFTSLSSSGTVGSSPYDMVLTAYPIYYNSYSPWLSNESKISFTNVECSTTPIEIIINQTHYALQAKGSVSNSRIVYRQASDAQIPVISNATWKATLTASDGSPTVSPTTGGVDNINYPATPIATENVTYNPGTVGKYAMTDITFTDTQAPKRFFDVTVSYIHCGSVKEDLTLEEWAKRAGFTQAEINSIPNTGGTCKNSSGTDKTMPNGIQLHKDQSGNIFLSGLFGTQRWMLHNLAALKYETTGRTGDDKKVNIALPAAPSLVVSYQAPQWSYPDSESDPTTFNSNKRLGLLYNWFAATNGRARYDLDGNLTASIGINDGEGGTNANAGSDLVISDPQIPQTVKIQGICPNGWHLPSDREWTDLEQEICTNTSEYSGLPNDGSTIIIGNVQGRGKTHGQAMVDPCASSTNTFIGESNPISNGSTKPGFNVLYASSAGTFPGATGQGGGTIGLPAGPVGHDATFQTASGSSFALVWLRHFGYDEKNVRRNNWTRETHRSIRCKKD